MRRAVDEQSALNSRSSSCGSVVARERTTWQQDRRDGRKGGKGSVAENKNEIGISQLRCRGSCLIEAACQSTTPVGEMNDTCKQGLGLLSSFIHIMTHSRTDLAAAKALRAATEGRSLHSRCAREALRRRGYPRIPATCKMNRSLVE